VDDPRSHAVVKVCQTPMAFLFLLNPVFLTPGPPSEPSGAARSPSCFPGGNSLRLRAVGPPPLLLLGLWGFCFPRTDLPQYLLDGGESLSGSCHRVSIVDPSLRVFLSAVSCGRGAILVYEHFEKSGGHSSRFLTVLIATPLTQCRTVVPFLRPPLPDFCAPLELPLRCFIKGLDLFTWDDLL